MIDFQGEPAVQIIIRDITGGKRREEELSRLNRTLRALSNSNQAMMHATDESEYLQEVCRVVVEDCGHAMVWIGYAEEDEGKTVRPVAHAGFDEGYLERLEHHLGGYRTRPRAHGHGYQNRESKYVQKYAD